MASLGRGVMNRRSGDRRINLLVALSTGLTPRGLVWRSNILLPAMSKNNLKSAKVKISDSLKTEEKQLCMDPRKL